ncbi:ABC transporter permease [Paenibacillus turicensis]|uniref:ABC transporter permease n=1 Tax=Paenibacillus turicensis TaxID=160487 RepID=UPI003D2B7C72
MYKLKSSQDYSHATFSFIISLVLTIILLLNSFDFATNSINSFMFYLFIAYTFFTVIQGIITWRIRKDILIKGEISTFTRSLGFLQLLSIFTANIFVGASGFQLVKKEKNTEYTLAVYTFLTGLFVIGISALNLFKPYVSNTFIPAMLVLILFMVFHLIVLLLISKFVVNHYAPKWMLPIAFLLILTTISGNLFALLLGINLIVKVKHKGVAVTAKWKTIWDKLTTNISAMVGLFFVILLFSISICSVYTFDYDMAIANNYSAILQPPSLAYPLGTDNFGRCLFSRIIFGARISLIVGFISTLIPVIIGGILGALAGYYGRHADNWIMRLLDILYAIPGILLAIAIIAAFGANTVNLIIALSVGAIPTYARTMRANVLMVSTYEFVDAARAFGSSNFKIIFKHIVPNSLAPMIVKSTLTIGSAVIATSSLSFLGLGVEPHIPEWGNILKLGSTYLETNSYLAIYPGLAIILLVLSFNFLGDGLRDALDPKIS